MVFFDGWFRFVDAFLCPSSPRRKKTCYLAWTWVLTFVIYTTFHLSRKPISVVKNVLNENCSKLTPPVPVNNSHWCDWKPFDTDESSTLLGTLDSAFLFTYAVSMFFSGMIAERTNLNVFLCIGMVTSGIFTALFGLGYTFGIHIYWYYLLVQLLCGFFQSSGWPGVVTVMGNWFGKKRRGFIMGIWNSHTSVGNILGTLIAGRFLISGWDMSFIVPGIIIAVLGIFVLFFLVPEPSIVGLPSQRLLKIQGNEETSDSVGEASSLLGEEGRVLSRNISQNSLPEVTTSEDILDEKPITFHGALAIPGVIEFSMSLFFSKLVSYTFLYWLPHFIFDSTDSDADESAKVSTFFDLGGIVGGILAGILSDTSGMPASTCSIMLIAAIPMIFIYQAVAKFVSLTGNILLLLPVGLLVNGPYALITTAVSTELGTHSSLRGNAKALSTVTSIIDGTGSMGAAIGPLIAGSLSNSGNWCNVFYMLMIADVLSLLFLVRLVKKEVVSCVRRRMYVQ